MSRLLILVLILMISGFVKAGEDSDSVKIKRTVLDYIESQHNVDSEMMKRGLDSKLAKRTYWIDKDGNEVIMETGFDTMVWVAENYNKSGDKFPEKPKVDIKILDFDNRAASVKLTVDDWIDYMHLYRNKDGQWKIINVLWQYHDENKHKS